MATVFNQQLNQVLQSADVLRIKTRPKDNSRPKSHQQVRVNEGNHAQRKDHESFIRRKAGPAVKLLTVPSTTQTPTTTPTTTSTTRTTTITTATPPCGGPCRYTSCNTLMCTCDATHKTVHEDECTTIINPCAHALPHALCTRCNGELYDTNSLQDVDSSSQCTVTNNCNPGTTTMKTIAPAPTPAPTPALTPASPLAPTPSATSTSPATTTKSTSPSTTTATKSTSPSTITTKATPAPTPATIIPPGTITLVPAPSPAPATTSYVGFIG